MRQARRNLLRKITEALGRGPRPVIITDNPRIVRPQLIAKMHLTEPAGDGLIVANWLSESLRPTQLRRMVRAVEEAGRPAEHGLLGQVTDALQSAHYPVVITGSPATARGELSKIGLSEDEIASLIVADWVTAHYPPDALARMRRAVEAEEPALVRG